MRTTYRHWAFFNPVSSYDTEGSSSTAKAVLRHMQWKFEGTKQNAIGEPPHSTRYFTVRAAYSLGIIKPRDIASYHEGCVLVSH